MKRTTLLAGSLSLLGLIAAPVPAQAEVNELATAVDLGETAQVLEEPAADINSPVLVADRSLSDILDETYEESLDRDSLVSLDADDTLGVVQSVDQLTDVSPTDWAYQALSELIQNWNCIAGYPDGTFRGQQFATRFELAAALNECLNTVNLRFATKEELEAVKRLAEEFAAELAVIKGRVDQLEARTDLLEDQQFATLTKLKGEAIMMGSFVADNQNLPGFELVSNAGNTAPNVIGAVPGPARAVDEDNFFSGYRVRLNLDTSFTGSDRLRIRLEAADIAELDGTSCGTDLCRLGFDEDDPAGSTVILDELNYLFKPIDNLQLKFAVVGGDYKDDVQTFNPLKSSGSGALSRFFRVNPVVHRAPGATTISAIYEINDIFEISAMYAADRAERATDDPSLGPIASSRNGLFDGQFGALAQLAVTPRDDLRFGFQYAFSNFKGSGVNLTNSTADAPTNLGGDSNTLQPFGDVDTIAHNFGFNVQYQPVDKFIFAGWVGLTLAHCQDAIAACLVEDLGLAPGVGVTDSEVKLINWAANFIFPDALVEGNRASLSVGQAPYIIDGGALDISDGQDPNILVEAQYQVKVNKFIKISPGVIVVINAENTGANDPIIIPVIRTTFKF